MVLLCSCPVTHQENKRSEETDCGVLPFVCRKAKPSRLTAFRKQENTGHLGFGISGWVVHWTKWCPSLSACGLQGHVMVTVCSLVGGLIEPRTLRETPVWSGSFRKKKNTQGACLSCGLIRRIGTSSLGLSRIWRPMCSLSGTPFSLLRSPQLQKGASQGSEAGAVRAWEEGADIHTMSIHPQQSANRNNPQKSSAKPLSASRSH